MTDEAIEKFKLIWNSPILFMENFMMVENKDKKAVPFKLNELQRDFMKNRDTFNVILKSRQLGFSTLMNALSLYYAITEPDTSCLLMSYSDKSVTKIFEKLKWAYNHINPSVRPKLINNNKTSLKFDNGSVIDVAVCSPKDVARGSTLSFVHISEMGLMDSECIKNNLLAIEQAMIPSATLTVESTARGINAFEELYTSASRHENLYKPFFYNWYQNKSMFAGSYQKDHKIFVRQNNGKALTEEDLTEYEKKLYEKGATLIQLEWRRIKILSNKGTQSEKEAQFRQEYPANPTEAFIASSTSLFDTDKIVERVMNIPKPIELNHLNNLPSVLVPYIKNKSLKIYEDVSKNERYYAGVDCSEGVGQDFDVIEILNRDGVQVAEFRNNEIAPHVFTEIIYELLTYFNKAYVVIEKASAGTNIIKDLRREYGYMNMHKHKIFDQKGRSKKELGFITSEKTKSYIVNDFRKAFDENQVLINSDVVLDEMTTFCVIGTGMGATTGKHDDSIMAMMMCWHGLLTGIQYCS